MLGLRELVGVMLESEGLNYELRDEGDVSVISTRNFTFKIERSGRFELIPASGPRLTGFALTTASSFVRLRVHDSSLNFDYSHFLPHIEKCSTLHGHTATVSMEVVGPLGHGDYLVDFGQLKRDLKFVLNDIDHKLIASRRYVETSRDSQVTLRFVGKGGEYVLTLPSERVVLLDGESTAENISKHIAERVAENLRVAPLLVRVEMSEGTGKFASSEVLVLGSRERP
ncbi:MAG: 6-carboxytetrahydropterin synthase [Thaumarchaeota archaeon]|nr:6-carboxytetrahydropterin synthase [Candidatus Calditenuaceae archaeon]MDW8187076.1 6-carboxytetrahydropterin synthase [Nitrososphaerota archaeon]